MRRPLRLRHLPLDHEHFGRILVSLWQRDLNPLLIVRNTQSFWARPSVHSCYLHAAETVWIISVVDVEEATLPFALRIRTIPDISSNYS